MLPIGENVCNDSESIKKLTRHFDGSPVVMKRDERKPSGVRGITAIPASSSFRGDFFPMNVL